MKKILFALILSSYAFLNAMSKDDDHRYDHIVNRSIVAKITHDTKPWNITVSPASSDFAPWQYDQRVLLWDYNKRSALATCPKAIGQTDPIRECYHFYPLAIEALYLDHAIVGHVPLEHNKYHEDDRCYYFPGFIKFRNKDGRTQRIDGFFESTFNKDGSILYHRCFHQALEKNSERIWSYPKEVRRAETATRENWKNYCRMDWLGEISREEHAKTVTIHVPTHLQWAKKDPARDVVRTYDVCEIVTDLPECPIPCVEFIDQKMPGVVYGIFTSINKNNKL